MMVENREKRMDMAGLNAVAKNRITEVLDSTCFRQQGFTVKYDDERNPIVTITASSSSEYRFAINSIDNDAFVTIECPGIHVDAAETFQQHSFELCINAIKEWVDRIIDREKDWMLDEFGGAADRTPSY
jgi:hypothetical protein